MSPPTLTLNPRKKSQKERKRSPAVNLRRIQTLLIRRLKKKVGEYPGEMCMILVRKGAVPSM